MAGKVSITDEKLIIGEIEFLHSQARDNCKCDICWNVSLQQRRKNPPTEPLLVTACHVEQNIAHVEWSDGHKGHLELELDAKVSRHCTENALRRTPLSLWETSLHNNMSHRYDYTEVINNPSQQYNMFQTFLRTGIVQIANSPLKNDNDPGLVDIAKRLGEKSL